MIAHIRGTLLSKSDSSAVIDAGGVGYEVNMAPASAGNLPGIGQEARLLVSESIGMYGGTTLYAFFNSDEKQLFELFKEAVPNTGAKKAIEYLNKALKSLPDFRRAVIENDTRLLTGIFGFTKKTAERLVSALKDKMPAIAGEGAEIETRAVGDVSSYGQVLNALASLGYKYAESRAAVQIIQEEGLKPGEKVEDMLRRALRKLSK